MGSSMVPNQVLNGELNTCDVSMVQTRKPPQSIIVLICTASFAAEHDHAHHLS